jgi:hypothetical protein
MKRVDSAPRPSHLARVKEKQREIQITIGMVRIKNGSSSMLTRTLFIGPQEPHLSPK